MNGPLGSLKVLDFSTLLPGPFASLLLADLGADVLRVESPTRPDLVRTMPPYVGRVSAVHAYLNRGKRSISLDLKQAKAVETIKRLVHTYDIVLEQFRPGVMERLGLGYEALRAENPSLIFCSLTGYGQTGPYRVRAGHDLNYLAVAGVSGYSGRGDTGPPPLGIQAADLSGSLYTVAGLLAAVVHRQQTGEGQYVDISMTDAAFSLNALASSAMLAGGDVPAPEQTQLNGGGLYDYYRTRDGRWLAVGCLEPKFVAAFLEAIGLRELLPALQALDSLQRRSAKRQVADAIATRDLAEWQTVFAESDAIATRDLAEWQTVFAESDACVEPVLTLEEAARHPQLTARGMITEVPGPDGTTLYQPACPLRFSDGLAPPRFYGRRVGADNEQVMTELDREASTESR